MTGNVRARGLAGIHTAEDLKARCWVDDDTGCWNWRGALDSNGTPSVWLPALRRRVSLGVVACWLATGAGPLPGQAWHCTCTTQFCANPGHRTCGTRSSQMLAARMTRNPLQRARISAGKRRANGKLTDAQRAEIAGSDEVLRVLSERYGISISQAHKLRSARQSQSSVRSSVFTWRPS